MTGRERTMWKALLVVLSCAVLAQSARAQVGGPDVTVSVDQYQAPLWLEGGRWVTRDATVSLRAELAPPIVIEPAGLMILGRSGTVHRLAKAGPGPIVHVAYDELTGRMATLSRGGDVLRAYQLVEADQFSGPVEAASIALALVCRDENRRMSPALTKTASTQEAVGVDWKLPSCSPFASSCGNNEPCSVGTNCTLCFPTSTLWHDGGGACVDANTTCLVLLNCGSYPCPLGTVCVNNTCCGQPVCLPIGWSCFSSPFSSSSGPDSWANPFELSLLTKLHVAWVLVETGRPEEAEGILREPVATMEAMLPPGVPLLTEARSLLTRAQVR